MVSPTSVSGNPPASPNARAHSSLWAPREGFHGQREKVLPLGPPSHPRWAPLKHTHTEPASRQPVPGSLRDGKRAHRPGPSPGTFPKLPSCRKQMSGRQWGHRRLDVRRRRCAPVASQAAATDPGGLRDWEGRGGEPGWVCFLPRDLAARPCPRPSGRAGAGRPLLPRLAAQSASAPRPARPSPAAPLPRPPPELRKASFDCHLLGIWKNDSVGTGGRREEARGARSGEKNP